MTRVLFVCGMGRLRSPTAEQVFAGWRGRDGARTPLQTASAGTNHDADTPLSPELIEWADIILVMEEAHRAKLAARFRNVLRGKRVVCLNVGDDYTFMDPKLIEVLKERVVGVLE
jgi:predicted protein tyrosine phosphatase